MLLTRRGTMLLMHIALAPSTRLLISLAALMVAAGALIITQRAAPPTTSQVPEQAAAPLCPSVTLTLRACEPTDYLLRVRNESSVAVSVIPWDGATPYVVVPGTDEIVPTIGYPAPPWQVKIEEAETGAAVYERVIRGVQDE